MRAQQLADKINVYNNNNKDIYKLKCYKQNANKQKSVVFMKSLELSKENSSFPGQDISEKEIINLMKVYFLGK